MPLKCQYRNLRILKMFKKKSKESSYRLPTDQGFLKLLSGKMIQRNVLLQLVNFGNAKLGY